MQQFEKCFNWHAITWQPNEEFQWTRHNIATTYNQRTTVWDFKDEPNPGNPFRDWFLSLKSLVKGWDVVKNWNKNEHG